MPTFPPSVILWLSLIVIGFIAFIVTLLYYSIAGALTERASQPQAPKRETTAARRAEPASPPS